AWRASVARAFESGRILIHPPSLKWPLSLRGTSGGGGLGRGWGEGLVPSNCRALLKSPIPDPLPTSPSCGDRPATSARQLGRKPDRDPVIPQNSAPDQQKLRCQKNSQYVTLVFVGTFIARTRQFDLR